jgi:hypothetical protein
VVVASGHVVVMLMHNSPEKDMPCMSFSVARRASDSVVQHNLSLSLALYAYSLSLLPKIGRAAEERAWHVVCA